MARGLFHGRRADVGAGTQDQAYGLAYMNPLSWGVSSYGPVSYMCLGQDLTDAEMAARAYFPALSTLMQVTIQNVDRPPDLKPLVELIEQQWRASWPETARAWADGVVIRAHVRTQQRENDAYFVVITKHAEANYDGAIFRDGRTALVMGVFTPVGKLDEGHPGFVPILNNLRVNPQWKQLERQWWATRLRQPRPAGGRCGRGRYLDRGHDVRKLETARRHEGCGPRQVDQRHLGSPAVADALGRHRVAEPELQLRVGIAERGDHPDQQRQFQPDAGV